MNDANSGDEVGMVSKKWRGCCAESFTDMDTFKITFPPGATLATKGLLVGALMLVVSQLSH